MASLRRIVILAEGRFSPLESKTANQAIRYIPGEVVAVIDSRLAGRTAQEVLGFGGAIPVVRDLASSLLLKPDTLLVGIAPAGGLLPEVWRRILLDAIASRLDIVSGLHTLIADDPEFSAMAASCSVRITDLRRVSAAHHVVASGSWRQRLAKTVLTVGTDCNVGKMTASLELHREFQARGERSAFLATGQTGILLSGHGVAVDSVVSDFVAGAIEHELDRVAASGCRYVHVEGQGSLTHQGYSGVTLGLLHGVMPDAMILVHHAARRRDDYGLDLEDLPRAIALHESLVAPFKDSRVVGVAVNTLGMSPEEAGSAIREVESRTSLPAADVLSGGRGRLADALLSYLQGTR